MLHAQRRRTATCNITELKSQVACALGKQVAGDAKKVGDWVSPRCTIYAYSCDMIPHVPGGRGWFGGGMC